MNTKRHGLSMGIERIQNKKFISIKAIGTLTHQDYEQIIPFIESYLKTLKDVKMDIFFDATEFEGWELAAIWDDFKFGLKHRNEFNKIAIIGNKNWQQTMTKIGQWFISGEIQFFEQTEPALTWLQ